MITREERDAIQDLYGEYASAIDEARYEDWLALFDDPCSYRIVPRENWDAGLPLALVSCENKNMLIDRIVALREANEYSIHSDRHIITGVRFRGREQDTLRVDADFAVYQTDSEGNASLFAVGIYRDEVQVRAGRAVFRSKTVVMDNSCVPHAISTPI